MKALLVKLFRWLRGRRKADYRTDPVAFARDILGIEVTQAQEELLCIYDEYPPMKMDPVAFAMEVEGAWPENRQNGIRVDNPVRQD